jgi:hypothetical protein
MKNKQLRHKSGGSCEEASACDGPDRALAVYPESDKAATAAAASNVTVIMRSRKQPVLQRGGFADLLYLYTERLVSIIRDEQVEVNH